MLDIEKRGNVTMIKLEHGKVNAMDLELCRALTRALQEGANESDGAFVLTGSGNAFSAGVDLLRLLREDTAYTRSFLRTFGEMLIAAYALPRPLVAAINGHAIAGGCVLALTCDYKMMAAGQGRIGLPELRVGVPFPKLALEIIKCSVPANQLPSLLYTGKTVLPDEALALGLVDEVVPAETLLESAYEIAGQFGNLSTEAFAATKKALRHAVYAMLQSSGAEIDEATMAIWTAESTRSRIQTYLEATLGQKKK